MEKRIKTIAAKYAANEYISGKISRALKLAKGDHAAALQMIEANLSSWEITASQLDDAQATFSKMFKDALREGRRIFALKRVNVKVMQNITFYSLSTSFYPSIIPAGYSGVLKALQAAESRKKNVAADDRQVFAVMASSDAREAYKYVRFDPEKGSIVEVVIDGLQMGIITARKGAMKAFGTECTERKQAAAEKAAAKEAAKTAMPEQGGKEAV